jgi:hypothetical protein
MTDQKPLTEQQLDDIETRADAATPGPWELYDGYGPHFYAYLRGSHLQGIGTLNFGDGEAADADRAFVLQAREDVPALLAEVRHLRNVLEQIRHLHKDSPMGPCPVCIDADAAAAGGDGLVPYPCPTGRLAGAQDCDPPHMRAAAAGERTAADASEASGTDADDLQARADACAEGDCPHAYQARSNESEASRYRHELETLEAYLEDRDGIDPAVAVTLRGILARALDR